ncbi:DDE-domain-containing protein [Apiospora arundinis]
MSSYEVQQRAQAAIRDVKLGMAVREAARKWDMRRTYLRRRLDGIPTKKEAYEDQQALSPLLESQLAQWVIGQSRLGFAPALVKFRFMAQQLLNASGASHTVGQRWHARFLARNEEIKTIRSKIIHYSRVNGATVSNIHLFFDRLDAPELANIPPERFYNTDEMGIGQGVGSDHWVLDVGVFGLLKRKLKVLVREGPNARLGLKPSKKDMLNAYRQARIDVLTPNVIRNAWRTSGIWPRDREKPLSSKYVILEDVGVARGRLDAPAVLIRDSTPDLLTEVAATPIKTPSGGQELRRSIRKLATNDPTFNLPSQRLFTRKASKALDQQASKIADLEARIDYLTTKLEKTAKKVRQKVTLTPGQRFIRMANIRQAKRRLRGRVVYEDEASDQDVPEKEITDTEDCIQVANV